MTACSDVCPSRGWREGSGDVTACSDILFGVLSWSPTGLHEDIEMGVVFWGPPCRLQQRRGGVPGSWF